MSPRSRVDQRGHAAAARRAIGELVAERSGVLNLGVEGMMLVGAVVGFAARIATGNALLGVVAGDRSAGAAWRCCSACSR